MNTKVLRFWAMVVFVVACASWSLYLDRPFSPGRQPRWHVIVHDSMGTPLRAFFDGLPAQVPAVPHGRRVGIR